MPLRRIEPHSPSIDIFAAKHHGEDCPASRHWTASNDVSLFEVGHAAQGRAAPPRENLKIGSIGREEEQLWPGRSLIQELAPGLCITNYFGSKKLAMIKNNRITHIMVCAAELPLSFPTHFQYLKLVGFTDNTHTPLKAHLDIALPWLHAVIQSGGRVLLHCAAGSSRSGAVAVAYMMERRGISAQQSLELVRRLRPIIAPNPGFMEQLDSWTSNSGTCAPN